MSELLRQYERWECLGDGYPEAWHRSTAYGAYPAGHSLANPAIKDLIRDQAGHRCLRCGHPYRKGEHGNGEWSACDKRCTHAGPARCKPTGEGEWVYDMGEFSLPPAVPNVVTHLQAQWRILTVHHLDEDKANCRWWNLAALCQRCHLRMQRAVVMGRPWHYEHSEWFRPFAAGFYAWKYEGADLNREQVDARMDELLAHERRFERLTLL